jgi:hypothetical protein
MNCRHARTEIALLAGGDLTDAVRVAELRRHVSGCTECRRHYRGLKSSLATLAGSDAAATWAQSASVWPAVHQAILTPPPTPAATAVQSLKNLRHWTPFAAMTAACLLMMFALGHNQPQQPTSLRAERGMATVPEFDSPPREKSPHPRSRSESESSGHTGEFGRF